MANEVILNTIFQLKRGTAEAWTRNNPVLRPAEPGFELDTGKLKIGDGTTAWKDLEYFTGDAEISADGKSIKLNDSQLLELAGFTAAGAGMVPRKNANGEIEWYTPIDIGIDEILKSDEFVSAVEENVDKILAGTEEEPGVQVQVEQLTEEVEELEKTVTEKVEGLEASLTEEINTLEAAVEKTKYEIVSIPENVLVDNREKEIRVMFPKDFVFEKQNVGATGDGNKWYMGFRAYAPETAVSFKEDLSEIINDNTMYYFEGNDFAGVDEFGRKYSIVWLPVANFDVNAQTWSYYGATSSADHFVGFYYTVEWYNVEGKIIGSDLIRINLSNEDCHNLIDDFNVAEFYQKKTDKISVSRLINDEDTIFIFNGGDVSNAILN